MTKLIHDRSTPLVYLITDRRSLPTQTSELVPRLLIEFLYRAIAAGVDLIQIRERDLSAREVLAVANATAGLLRDRTARVLINERTDIAACAGVGVHLTSRSLRVEVVREAVGPDMLIGVSTHTLDEARTAESGGADFIVFGPIFQTPSKMEYGDPVGLGALRLVTDSVAIPVLALGGIDQSNYRKTLDAGAAGVAGISMFSQSDDLVSLVSNIKRAT